MNDKRYFNWRLGYSENAVTRPDEYFPASVPGAVQKDYAAFKRYKPFYVGTEFKKLSFCEDKYWHYVTELDFTTESTECAFLHFAGVDYSCAVYINGTKIYRHEGMFSPFDIDVTRFSGQKAELRVVIDPVPKCERTGDRNEARKSCKADACYGWDWHPRLITSGIWDEVFLVIKNKCRFSDATLSYRLSDDLKNATIFFNCSFDEETSGTVLLSLTDKNGKSAEQTSIKITSKDTKATICVNSPRLWYPQGFGGQNTYCFTAEIIDENGSISDVFTRKIGFRRSKLVMNDGSWDKPDSFPKSRSDAPAQLEINGIKIFAKGSNWVNAEAFPCDMTEEKYRRLLTLVKDAGMNILRIWGGGFINKESFYDLCDEMGIMVWQEFPLACNEYPDEDPYLDILRTEAESIVRRLRTHPCVVLWCGGNELFNNWSGMTDQHHALRLLNSVCYAEDRFTPFIATSPLVGMSHGHYTSYDSTEKKETLRLFREAYSTAYTEFGTPSLASEKVLRLFAADEDLTDFSPDNEIWCEHHAFGAWLDGSWTDFDAIKYFFGENVNLGDIKDIAEKSRFIQAMNYKACFEEMRRQSPHCSLAINWCLNEPWPTAANNSIISWEYEPKPAYYAIKAALRPCIASLETEKLLWVEDELFRGRIWMLNDSLSPFDGDTVTVSVEFDGKTRTCGEFPFEKIAPQKNYEIGAVSFKIPNNFSGIFKVILTVKNQTAFSSEYEFPCLLNNGNSRTDGNTLNF